MRDYRVASVILLAALSALPPLCWSQQELAADWWQSIPSEPRFANRNERHSFFEPAAAVFHPGREELLLFGKGMLKLAPGSAEVLIQPGGLVSTAWGPTSNVQPISGVSVLDDGDLLVWGSASLSTGCQLSRISSSGVVRWQRAGNDQRLCTRKPLVLSDGSLVTVQITKTMEPGPLELVRITRNGAESRFASIEPQPNGSVGWSADPSHRYMNVYMAVWPETSIYQITQVDLATGALRWRTELPFDADVVEQVVNVNGRSWILYEKSYEYFLLSLDSNGNTVAEVRIPSIPGFESYSAMLSHAGVVYRFASEPGHLPAPKRKIVAFDFDGTQRWHIESTNYLCGPRVTAYCTVSVAGNGDLLLRGAVDVGGRSLPKVVERYSSDGVLRYAKTFETLAPIRSVLGQEESGAAIIPVDDEHVLFTQVGATDLGDSGSPFPTVQEAVETVELIDLSGRTVLSRVLPKLSIGYQEPVTAVTEDGSVFVVTVRNRVNNSEVHIPTPELAKITSDGAVNWRRFVEHASGLHHDALTLRACGGNVCLADPLVGIEAFGREYGSFKWQASFIFSYNAPVGFRPQIETFADGKVLARGFDGLALLDQSGQRTASWPSMMVEAFHPNHGAIVWNDALAHLTSGGELLPFFDLADSCDDCAISTRAALFDDDLGLTRMLVLSYGQLPSALVMERQINGEVLWARPLASVETWEWDDVAAQIVQLPTGNFVALFEERVRDGNMAHLWRSELLLVSISPQGEQLWRRDWSEGSLRSAHLVTDDHGRLLLAARRINDQRFFLASIDPVSGETIRHGAVRCPNGPCGPAAVAISDRGKISFVGAGGGLRGGDFPIARYSGMFDEPRLARIDQDGLAGAWYADYGSGQGFNFRYFPDASDGGTLFIPWFTFGQSGGSQPSQLRWYTIQGNISVGTTSANLPVYQTTGGRFGESGSSSREVGSVRLRFTSCDQALLDYQLDDNHEASASGSIALSRLLPRNRECLDGSGVLSGIERDFNEDVSGAWYEPRTSGQGLDLVVADPDHENGGLVFGTWYTFDPVAPSSAPADQHWFTLQGYEAAGDGSIRATIVQTLGGRLDGPSTHNHSPVGKVVLTSQSCDRLQLDYRFDDTELAGSFRGSAGSIPLQRIGACAAN